MNVDDLTIALEDLAYFAGQSDTVEGRRRLDLLLRQTLTYVNEAAEAEVVGT